MDPFFFLSQDSDKQDIESQSVKLIDDKDNDSDTDSTATTDHSSETHKHLKHIQAIHKEMSKKLDAIHDREFKKAIVQPVLLAVITLLIVICYIYFPLGLFGIIVFCFIFAWTFPALHIPLWVAIILLLIFGYHIVTGQFTWTWGPQ